MTTTLESVTDSRTAETPGGDSCPASCYPANTVTIINGDCRTALKEVPSESVQCVVTSPPYWGLRDYGHDAQIGKEPSPAAFVETMCEVFVEIWRVLRNDGTVWLNIGDTYLSSGGNTRGHGPNAQAGNTLADAVPQVNYGPRMKQAGLKPKDLCLIPARISLALQAAGWYVRNDIIWAKPNPMPESVTDRCTRAHEYIFLLTKSDRYYFDAAAIREPASYGEEHANKTTSWGTNRKHPNKNNVEKYAHTGDNKTCHVRTKNCQEKGLVNHSFHENRENGGADTIYYERNKRDVWNVTLQPCKAAHFATFPPDLIKPCILAGSKPGDVVLDPFGGSGTTGMVALELGRRAVLVELNPDYAKLCKQRCTTTPGLPLAG